ncbi:MAG: hypothetical protein LBD41_03185 [Clostridiales Family XIII bacterium]|jgi:hypothetical protein|nr:hypothetical protein [Clostridiales Family XIII bacterium]
MLISKLWSWLCSWSFGYDLPVLNGAFAVFFIVVIALLIIDAFRGDKSLFF